MTTRNTDVIRGPNSNHTRVDCLPWIEQSCIWCVHFRSPQLADTDDTRMGFIRTWPNRGHKLAPWLCLHKQNITNIRTRPGSYITGQLLHNNCVRGYVALSSLHPCNSYRPVYVYKDRAPSITLRILTSVPGARAYMDYEW